MSTQAMSKDEGEGRITVPEMVYFTKTAHHKSYSRISPFRPEASARGKNVVVTGGGTGIGKAIAVAFAQSGARSVSIVGRREDHLKTAINELQHASPAGVSSFLYKIADLRNRAQVDKAFDAIVESVGKIDILVSNAGALPDLKPVAGYDPDDFMRSFNLNVLTALNAVQAFLVRSGGKPMIINISSCIAHISPMPNVSGYAVSKAANLKLMDYFAAENPNVHIVSVQPGTVAADMAEQAGVPAKDESKISRFPLVKELED